MEEAPGGSSRRPGLNMRSGKPWLHRLVLPRLLAATLVAILLDAVVSVAGIAGGLWFGINSIHITASSFFATFGELSQIADLAIALVKAGIFGFIAAMVACYKGLYCKSGPKGVGDAVNQAVVVTFILSFFVNFLLTVAYMRGPGVTIRKIPSFTWFIIFTILAMAWSFPSLLAALVRSPRTVQGPRVERVGLVCDVAGEQSLCFSELALLHHLAGLLEFGIVGPANFLLDRLVGLLLKS